MRIALSLLLVFGLSLSASAQFKRTPQGWKEVGKVQGLTGEGWYYKKTRYCEAWAKYEDLTYIEQVVKGLDASYQANARYMGFSAPGPLQFYFCPMTEPAHTQPKFRSRLGYGFTRAAGVALGGTRMCVINLGSQRHGEPFAPWEVEATCRHEMNHLFAFSIKGSDRFNSWGWLYEALAERIENTVLPPGSSLDLPGMKTYMKGYSAQDASWSALVNERNRDDLEQYRDYEKLLASIIFFMEGKYGNNAVAKLMRSARGKDLEEGLESAFGKGSKELEKEWKAFYGIR